MFKLKGILKKLKIQKNKRSVGHFDDLEIQREKSNQEEPLRMIRNIKKTKRSLVNYAFIMIVGGLAIGTIGLLLSTENFAPVKASTTNNFAPEEDFVFSNGTITGYTGSDTFLVIPRSIDGQDVRRIEEFAFADIGLTYVWIPDTVTYIGVSAFWKNNLTEVVIPDSVITIRGWSFAENNLEIVYIGDSVTRIGNSAFYENNISSLWIDHSNVIEIAQHAFRYNNLTSVVIPDSVTSISYAAFHGNDIANVEIGDGVTEIPEYSFSSNNLTSVVIPDSVTNIESGAFYENDITSLKIGDSVTLGNDSIHSNFKELYERKGEKAGQYIYKDEQWVLNGVVLPPDDIPFENDDLERAEVEFGQKDPFLNEVIYETEDEGDMFHIEVGVDCFEEAKEKEVGIQIKTPFAVATIPLEAVKNILYFNEDSSERLSAYATTSQNETNDSSRLSSVVISFDKEQTDEKIEIAEYLDKKEENKKVGRIFDISLFAQYNTGTIIKCTHFEPPLKLSIKDLDGFERSNNLAVYNVVPKYDENNELKDVAVFFKGNHFRRDSFNFHSEHFSFFIPIEREAEGFDDVTSDKWYYNDVMEVASLNIIQGVGEGKFDPGKALKRVDFSIGLNRTLGRRPRNDLLIAYEDVDVFPRQYYAGDIASLNLIKVPDVYKETNFRVSEDIKRKEVAKFIANVAKYASSLNENAPEIRESSISYSDVDFNDDDNWAIRTITNMGIMQGDIDGEQRRFRPNDNLRRSEYAAILVNVLRNYNYFVYSSFVDIS